MKEKFKVFMLAVFAVAFSVFAETAVVTGGEVIHFGADEVKTLPNGDVVLVFTNVQTKASFTLPKNAKVRILAVGGGGAGGSMSAGDEIGQGAAGGGGAGGVSDHELILEPGDYTVLVGAGGARVQTIVQSWVGANGADTALLSGGQTRVVGKGGGGGGSVKVNGHGEAGGSGGGGSWFGSFTKGGTAIDGQGWAGGQSTNAWIGAGGGGAALTSAEGVGGADGVPGTGRLLNITGTNVVYGRGGRGGVRDTAYAPANGAGFGFGGDGAGMTGRGGAGGDGILIVRIHKLFDYTHVPYPVVPSFTWEEGKEYVAFDAATVDEPLKSAIDYVEGTTTTNGLGRFHYAIHLRDEYVWDDGSPQGSDRPFVAYWRVKEPGVLSEAVLEVTKTVDWNADDKAVISINVKTHPEMIEHVPNVLVLGSLCGAHGFSSDVLNAALNAITAVGNVDYYFFNENNSKTSVRAAFSGSLRKGEMSSGDVTIDGTRLEDKTSNHGTLYEFYAQLSTVIREIADGTRPDYDYIVFSFDRSLVASLFVGTHADEAAVVDYLKPFYANHAVIWLVDRQAGSDELLPDGLTQTPWFPCPVAFADVTEGQDYWTTLDNYCVLYAQQKSGMTLRSPYAYYAYKALMGLFCPSKYDALTQSSYAPDNSASIDVAKALRLSGTAIAEQETYDNASRVSALISNVVKAKASTIQVQDEIFVESGLLLDGDLTCALWTTNETTMGWRAFSEDEFIKTDSGVKLLCSGIRDPMEIRLSVGVVDTGTFRSSLNATYNERTGLWEKDPNKGAVVVSIKSDENDVVLATAQATSAVAWSFPTFRISGEITHGAGEIVVNGFITNALDVAVGCTPEVVFRGKGGYVLDYLEVDGQVVSDVTPDIYNWIFHDVGADHHIKVGFKSVFTTPYPTTGSAKRVYDGSAVLPTVTAPTFIEGHDYTWKAVYSLVSNGVYTADGGAVNVTSTNVYVRIWVDQPGYEDGVVVDDWTGVAPVMVTPRALTVKFDDYAQVSDEPKSTGFSYAIVAGTLVADDAIVANAGRCTRYPEKGDKAVDAIVAAGEMTVATPGFGAGNYAVTVRPGTYYYSDLELVAQAANVLKTYDGQATGATVTVLYPADAANETTASAWKYSENTYGYYKGRYVRYTRARTHVCTNRVFEIAYSPDGQNYSTNAPSFTDAGPYTLHCRVRYREQSYTETQRRSSPVDWSSATGITTNRSDAIDKEYTPYVGTATVMILPRPVEVRADSAEKEYDGTALTASGYTIAEATGFVDGQGFAVVPMTVDSTITNPGTRANKIDTVHVVFKDGTKASNYAIAYVEGTLKVNQNPLTVTATKYEKVYDGQPAEPIAVTVLDSHGRPLPAGSYTIAYRTSLNGVSQTTVPQPPTDAGEYPLFYTVDGGAGYGVTAGVTITRITPRTVTLQAASAEKSYDGTPLTETGFTVVPDSADGFVAGDGIASVTMTADSILTKVGSVANTIDVYDTEHWTMKGGTKAQNYEFSAQPGTLRVVRSTTPPMIIDHEPHAKGWVHLAFKPHPMDEDDFKQWVADTSTNGKIRVKFGETRDTCDTCTPLAAELSDQHETSPEKVWIRVKLTNGVESVGYWRVCLAESDGGGATKARRAETGTDSVNVFGILKIESATTNTMISIPWTWYSAAETNAEHIPVRKLVKTTNLTTGDMLYASVDDGSTYAAWTLFDGVWQPCSTVKVDRNGTGRVKVVADEEDDAGDYGRARRVARGNALWVVRRKPVDTDGRPIPFWIYGQSVTTEVANIVFAPTGTQTVVSTMLGNPYARDVKLNALDFEGEIASGDRIWFYTPQGVMKTLKYVSGKGWRMATTKLVDGSPRTVYTYDVTIPAGLGFWYDRRGVTDLRIKWPRPEGRK